METIEMAISHVRWLVGRRSDVCGYGVYSLSGEMPSTIDKTTIVLFDALNVLEAASVSQDFGALLRFSDPALAEAAFVTKKKALRTALNSPHVSYLDFLQYSNGVHLPTGVSICGVYRQRSDPTCVQPFDLFTQNLSQYFSVRLADEVVVGRDATDEGVFLQNRLTGAVELRYRAADEPAFAWKNFHEFCIEQIQRGMSSLKSGVAK